VIDEVGPHGDFLGTKHTRNHFREDWYPELFDRRNYDGWAAAGGKTLRQRASERVEEVLASHQTVSLPEDIQAAIDAVIERAEAGC
jgi:trimethylamine--corrinoid protein Co-methyltransferase